ncbi:MAG: GNAT family N-acetyltransferase [Polyangiaceae bacterium]|nr:GNAT family N-acetyltransferase [Polyangiaceae bacterium]
MQTLVREARPADLETIVRLFAIPGEGNALDADATFPVDRCYLDALDEVTRDPNQALLVADQQGRVRGVLQLTFIRHVGYRGGRVAQIENVIVAPEARSQGVGALLMHEALDRARSAGCFRAQLTSNNARTRAHAFYERLGFLRSHQGMKLALT